MSTENTGSNAASDELSCGPEGSEACVLIRRRGDFVAELVINRPSKRNALNDAVMRGLLNGLAQLKSDESTRVVVLTGAGDRAFCAGGDLTTMPSGGLLAMHESRGGFIEVLRSMQALGKPIIGRINGHAMGGGFGLMVACDLVLVADDVKLGMPEIKVGLFPMMIMALVFRNIGRKRGMELMLTGNTLRPDDALAFGLVNRSVPRDELDGSTDQLASQIAGYSPAILKLGRDAFYTTQDMEQFAALHYLQSQLTLNTLTEDCAEGVMAFMGKRAPEWKGR